ncbi:MAG: hypothetical protein IT538_07460 [Variibacter sp.]|nr:hypothetical protein [Variibacter sp.]
MRLRTLIRMTAVTALLGGGAWAATGLASWTIADADEAPQVVAVAGEPEPAAVGTEPSGNTGQHFAAGAPQEKLPGIFGWDPALLNPQRIAGVSSVAAPSEPPRLQAPLPQPAAVPMPPVRAEADAPPAHPTPAPDAQPRAAKTVQAVVAQVKNRLKRDSYDGSLTLAQVAQIKHRLRLSPDQEEYWKPVEAMLVGMIKKHRGGGKVVLNAVEMQNLYWTAGPLVMRLREDQKNEARKLARAMGLETVASLI